MRDRGELWGRLARFWRWRGRRALCLAAPGEGWPAMQRPFRPSAGQTQHRIMAQDRAGRNAMGLGRPWGPIMGAPAPEAADGFCGYNLCGVCCPLLSPSFPPAFSLFQRTLCLDLPGLPVRPVRPAQDSTSRLHILPHHAAHAPPGLPWVITKPRTAILSFLGRTWVEAAAAAFVHFYVLSQESNWCNYCTVLYGTPLHLAMVVKGSGSKSKTPGSPSDCSRLYPTAISGRVIPAHWNRTDARSSP